MSKVRSIAVAFVILAYTPALAQNNLQLHYGYRGSVSAAKFLPSTLTLGSSKLMVGINYKLWVANRSLSYKTIQDIRRKNKITSGDISSFIHELDADNIIGAGQDIMLLGIGFATTISQRRVNFSLSISDRMSVSFHYPKDLLELAWRGNASFEGQTVDLSSTSLDARYFREYAFGAAMEVFRSGPFRIRSGATLKYYYGLAAIYMPRNAMYFTTGENGDYLELKYSYEVLMSGIENLSFLDRKGYGWGTNVGVTASYNKRYFLDVALSDVGTIRFDNDTKVFNDNNTLLYSGLTRDDLNDVKNYADSLANIFDNKTTVGQSFSMPLGARLFVQLSYQFINDDAEKNPGNLFLTYVQGFRELPGVTRRPRISVGYNQRVVKRLFMGVSSSWGGFNNLALGGTIGFRLGKTRFGVHCDDFTGLLFPELGTGAGFGFVVQSAF